MKTCEAALDRSGADPEDWQLLSRQAAQRVLGWAPECCGDTSRYIRPDGSVVAVGAWDASAFNPAVSIADAMEVFRALSGKDGWEPHLRTENTFKGVYWEVLMDHGVRDPLAEMVTDWDALPATICRLALGALG